MREIIDKQQIGALWMSESKVFYLDVQRLFLVRVGGGLTKKKINLSFSIIPHPNTILSPPITVVPRVPNVPPFPCTVTPTAHVIISVIIIIIITTTTTIGRVRVVYVATAQPTTIIHTMQVATTSVCLAKVCRFLKQQLTRMMLICLTEGSSMLMRFQCVVSVMRSRFIMIVIFRKNVLLRKCTGKFNNAVFVVLFY